MRDGAGWLPRTQDRLEVSVVTAFWNTREEWILQSARSTLAQTHEEGGPELEVELVLVDDGSEDEYLLQRVVEALDDPRVIPVGITHRGVGAASNVGVGEATHELVARMDSDDLMLPSRLFWQGTYLQEHLHVQVIAGGMEYVTADLEPIREVLPSEAHGFRGYHGQVYHGASMFRRGAWELAGGYPEEDRKGADWRFFKKLERWRAHFSTWPELAIRRRIHRESHSYPHSKHLQKVLEEHVGP